MTRVVVAVIIAFVIWSILWVAAAQVGRFIAPGAINAEGTISTTSALLLFVILSVAISIVSGMSVVKIAPGHALKPAWILGGALFIVGLVVEVYAWDTAPAWYHIAFLALLVPGVISGARLTRH